MVLFEDFKVTAENNDGNQVEIDKTTRELAVLRVVNSINYYSKQKGSFISYYDQEKQLFFTVLFP